MLKEKAKTIKKALTRIKKPVIVLILAMVVLTVALGSGFLLLKERQPQEKPKPPPAPSVSIGCDRVLWKGTEIELSASIQNIDKPLFEWTVDGTIAGSSQKLGQKFSMGQHQITLNVSFGNRTLNAKQTTIVIDSADGVSVRDSQASKNQWGFQTTYNGKNFGVKGVRVSLDSQPPSEVNPCGSFSTKALLAGEHKWRAEYQGKTIASGTFKLKEASEIKITGIGVAPGYNAGDTVNGKIVLKNTGSTAVTGFDIKTLVVNNNYAWMGDKAKREYFDQYNSNIKPGETYEVPITVTIPEKVSGIRPSGKYTITVTLMLKGQVADIKVVNTEVK